jgi:hypothetical protein
MIKKYKHIDLCTPIDKIEFGKEIYLNKFSDFSKESAELALMAADDFIGVLKKHYQNKD